MSLSRVYVRGSRLRWQSCVGIKLKRNLSPSKAKAALLALRFLLTDNLYRKTKTAAFELRITTNVEQQKTRQLIFDRALQELQLHYGSRLFAAFTATLGSKPCLFVYICPTPTIGTLELCGQDLWDSPLFRTIARDFNVMFDITLQQSLVFKLLELINSGRH